MQDEPATVTVEGPWAVYDCYCMKCAYRYLAVAVIQTEEHDLWECPTCRTFAVTWHPYPDDDES